MRPIKHCICGNICEGTTDACASCNSAARRNERASKKVQVVRQPNKVSAKRAAQLPEYWRLKKEYLSLYIVCEVENCNEPSVDIHHQKGRENHLLTDTNYFFACCRKHHDEFTEHSKKAKEDGHSVSRTGKQEKGMV